MVKEVLRVIKYNKKSSLKPYIDMNTEMNKKEKDDFEKKKKFKKNSVFRKTLENVRKHRYIKLAKREKQEIIWYQNQIIILQ